MTFSKWDHKFLNIMNVSFPIIFAMILSCILTTKLFNPEVSFVLVDYALIGVSIFIIFMFQKERWNDLNKTFAVHAISETEDKNGKL